MGYIQILAENRAEITTVLAALGFILGILNLLIKWNETRENPHILLFGAGDGDVREIIRGEFYKNTQRIVDGQLNPNYELKEGEIYLNLIYNNRGGRALHIVSQRVYIKDRRLNQFFVYQLEHSTDFKKVDIGGEKYKRYNAYHELISIPGYSSINKHYLIPISSGVTHSTKPNFFHSGDIYLAFQTSSGRSYFQKLI